VDRFQIVERLLPRCAPFGDGFDLGRRNFFVDLGIAVLRAQAEAFEELAACSLTFLGPREMDPKPKMIGVVISGAEDFLRLRRLRLAMPSPLRGPVPTRTRRLTRSGA
jgi:hypothetical protein